MICLDSSLWEIEEFVYRNSNISTQQVLHGIVHFGFYYYPDVLQASVFFSLLQLNKTCSDFFRRKTEDNDGEEKPNDVVIVKWR